MYMFSDKLPIFRAQWLSSRDQLRSLLVWDSALRCLPQPSQAFSPNIHARLAIV